MAPYYLTLQHLSPITNSNPLSKILIISENMKTPFYYLKKTVITPPLSEGPLYLGLQTAACLRTTLCMLLAIVTIGFLAESVIAQAITTSYVPVTTKAETGVTVNYSKSGGKMTYNAVFSPTRKYNTLDFYPMNGGNLSNASALLIDVTSNNDIAVTLVMRVIDRNSVIYAGKTTLVPRQEKTIAFPFAPLHPYAYGLLMPPAVVKYMTNNVQQIDENFTTPFNTKWAAPSNVKSIQVLIEPIDGPINLSFSQPQIQINGIIPNPYKNMIDIYGQSTQGTWPEKVSSIADMQSKENAETQQLRQWTADRTDLDSLDSFGGTKSIQLKNDTGFFRTSYSNGRWWLVTPEGHGFFQLALDAITPENGYTITDRRHWMFEDLSHLQATYPNQMTPLIQKGGHEYFNYYGANLERKYGSSLNPTTKLPIYFEQFLQRAMWRLEAWRFNTIGWMSDPKITLHPKLPFVYGVRVKHYFNGATVTGYASNHLGYMPDPFDPKFDSAVKQTLKEIPNYMINNNYLIGYFIDNELPWGDDQAEFNNYKDYYALSINSLVFDFRQSPAKRAFIYMLYQKYGGNIARLNAAWGTSIPSWEVLKKPYSDFPETPNAALKADLSAFLRKFADQYFSTVKKELKAYDSNHLYLGCRFSQHEGPNEAVASCTSYADAVSFNRYDYHVNNHVKRQFTWVTNKPIILSEFQFGSRDRGPAWPGLVDAGSEANRGSWYSQYVNELAALPNVIGCDYYQYIDEPTSGERYDDGNGHLGFVSVTDVPFLDFATSVRQTNMRAAAIHATAPIIQTPITPIPITPTSVMPIPVMPTPITSQ